MKRLKLITTGLCATTILVLVLYACRKHDHGPGGGGITSTWDLHPISYPTFTTNDEINSQLRALAYAVAGACDDKFMMNDKPHEYKVDIESLMPANEDEISFEDINNQISMTGSTIYQIPPVNNPPSSFQAYVGIILSDETPNYLLYNPRTSVNAYDPFGYGGFTYSNTGYYTLLRIPDYADVVTDVNRLHKPLLVIPHELDTFGKLVLPILGYKVDSLTNTMDTVYYQSEDELDEDSVHYIWVVDCAQKSPAPSTPGYNCTGIDAPVQNDGYCDRDCGEDSIHSVNDCAGQYLRKVWIDEIEISEDFKRKCGSPDYQWFESRLNGQYEIAYQCVVIHSNGKIKPRGGRLNERWHRSQVYKTKKLGLFCSFKTKGSVNNQGNLTAAQWWVNSYRADLIGENNTKSAQPKCYFSENYKPWRDTIFFIVYEQDRGLRRKHNHSFDVYYRAGQKYSMEYVTLDGEGVFADKNNGDAPESYNAIGGGGKVFMITPGTWPGGGAPSVAGDVYTFNAITSSGGAIADTRSVKVKVRYGPY